MDKIQQFVVDGILYSMQSTYYEDDKVWCADIEPYEWNTESAMRIDMLIHFLAEDQQERSLFEGWDCRGVYEFIEKYEQWKYASTEEDYDYYNE